MQICIFLSSFASHYYILKGTITVLMEFHFMYQLVYNHYFKKGIFSSLCALEAKNSKSVPFTELSHLAKFTLVILNHKKSKSERLNILCMIFNFKKI